MVEGFCVKCKSKREMKGGKNMKTKNGRHAVSGNCSKCNCKMMRFVKEGEGIFDECCKSTDAVAPSFTPIPPAPSSC